MRNEVRNEGTNQGTNDQKKKGAGGGGRARGFATDALTQLEKAALAPIVAGPCGAAI